MAIIKCDDGSSEDPGDGGGGGGDTGDTTKEAYVYTDKVSLGKTLLAVESGFFLSDTLNPIISDISTSTEDLLKTRTQDISDSFRAESNRYWTLDEDGNMKYMNTNINDWAENVNIISPTPPFKFIAHTIAADGETELGLPIYSGSYTIMANSLRIPNDGVWKAIVEGGIYLKNGEEEFSRSSPLISTGSTFTDHAFTMNTPFTKKELEMFANIEGVVSVADVESDYDFFAKAYEVGIASTTVPENSLPHLYTEVQKSENADENTTQLPKGYLRSWVSEILSDAEAMRVTAKEYENVAILDSTVSEGEIIGSESISTSAFDILMAYANRENLFPMNVNIEVDTNNASDVMFMAEDVGMVDDIIRMLMGDGDVSHYENLVIEQIDYEIAAAHYDTVQFTAALLKDGVSEPVAPIWTLNTTDYGTISSSGIFTPKDEEATDTNALSRDVKVTASYLSLESSTDLLIYPVITIPPDPDPDNDEDAESEDEDANDDALYVFRGNNSSELGGEPSGNGFDADGNNVEDIADELDGDGDGEDLQI